MKEIREIRFIQVTNEKELDAIYAQFFLNGEQVGKNWFVAFEASLSALIIDWLEFGLRP